MAVSRSTQLTHELMDEIAKREDPLSALAYLITHAANTIIDCEGESMEARAACLEREAQFVTTRAQQTRAAVPQPDPDEDLL